ncbi:MAG TPA: glycosyltransferase family 1 protein [Terriglobales bacterium]
MKVLLLRNYPYDGSVSMRVFADAMRRELKDAGITFDEIAPKPVFGRILPGKNGLGKWLGYIDRFILFPSAFRRAACNADLVHICDHGNAMYTGMLSDVPVVVTCHDMLAVRGALGEVEDCKPSVFGGFLQKWIVDGLRKATRVACVSQFTLEDVARVLGTKDNVCKVLNGLPYPFGLLEVNEADKRLEAIGGLRKPFILHVGSDHRRKNRECVVRVFAKVRQKYDCQLVLAGEAPAPRLLTLANELGIRDNVIIAVRPETEVIEALYNRAIALLFPSRYEGFGWPPIEAQACGCPVVASDIPPIAEVLGDSAERFALEDEDGMATAIVRLAADSAHREQMRQRGFENISRFQALRMMADYLKLYQEILSSNSKAQAK